MANPIIEVWTIAIPQWRKAKALDITLLDITAKSGIPAFAPDFKHVMDYKAGKLSEEDYTKFYYGKMRKSLIDNPEDWEKLLSFDKVAVACYCTAGQFCHRLLFTDMMKKYCFSKGIHVTLKGEIT